MKNKSSYDEGKFGTLKLSFELILQPLISDAFSINCNTIQEYLKRSDTNEATVKQSEYPSEFLPPPLSPTDWKSIFESILHFTETITIWKRKHS